MLGDLIRRQDEQARAIISRQDEQAQILDNIQSYHRSRGISSSAASAHHPSSASRASHPSGYPDNSDVDNSSIMSKSSTLSLQLGQSRFIKDLKASRPYKRLRYFGLGTDSSSDSVLSFDSACTGNWSILSDITLGDLSVSQIAVLNLPIGLADVSNPEPYQDRLSIATPRSPKSPVRSKRSSRGRIHNAIENGNVFVIRTLLALGMDIEELDSNGRTPLVHAIMKHQEAICKLLLEKGAFFFFFFLESIRLISLRLCGGLEPLTEPSFGAVDPRENNYLNQLTTDCERPVYKLYRNAKHRNK